MPEILQRKACSDECAGAMLGPYRILECIGDGGMGRVYRAEHVELGRPAAIKFLLPHYAADPEAASRFMLEAKAVNMVRHANLVDIYDVFVDPERGVRAYVMELLSGWSLRDAMMPEPLDLRTVFAIARQIASALHAVHGAGVVHRDIKPENIYLCPRPGGDASVKVIDFGIAKFTRGDAPFQTGAGTAVGSPWYMAPEQASEKPVNHLADVYSLGVLLYEMLTGCVPFTGSGFAQVVEGHLTKTPPPLRRRDGRTPPAPIRAVVLRCLEKDPAARPADMAALWHDLSEAAGPLLAPSRGLIPPLAPVASTSLSETPVIVAAPPKGESPSLVRRRAITRRLAVLSFAFGLVGGLAMLSALAAPERGVSSTPGGDPASRALPTPAKAKPPTPAPRNAPQATASVEAPAPAPQPAAGPAAKAPKRLASAKRASAKRASAKKSRWSEAAFDKKRSKARRRRKGR